MEHVTDTEQKSPGCMAGMMQDKRDAHSVRFS